MNNADLNNELSKVEIPEERTSEKIKTTTSEENKVERPPLMDFLDIRASISGYQSFRKTDFGIILEHIFFCYGCDMFIFITQELT